MVVSKLTLGLAVAVGAVAAVAALSLGGYSNARAQAGVAPCTCSAPVEVVTGALPTSARASITNCQCGAQSCAVLNSQVLQCSR